VQLDVSDLRLFALIAEERNITRAAVRHHLSLAAASSRIKALEQQAGVPLLVREARGVHLTPPGETFLHHARVMLLEADKLRRDLHEFGAGLRGWLRVYANTTAVTDFLPEVLPDFLAANPRINVDLQEKPNAEIARGVHEGRADLGIGAGPMEPLGLQVIPFSTDRLVLVAGRSHRLARRKRIAFAEVLGEDFVGMHHGSTLQSFLEVQADSIGKMLKLRIQVRSFDAMCQFVGSGVGVAVMPESAAHRNLKPMKLVQVELTDSWRVRDRYILARDAEELPAYALDLIERIRGHHGDRRS